MESWREVWRVTAPMLPEAGLLALRDALAADSPALIQGATTSPPPLACVSDWPIEGACLIGFCFWKANGADVGEVEEYFARTCYEIDQALGEPSGCRYLLNAYDEWPRAEMIANLLPEVERELARRKEAG